MKPVYDVYIKVSQPQVVQCQCDIEWRTEDVLKTFSFELKWNYLEIFNLEAFLGHNLGDNLAATKNIE